MCIFDYICIFTKFEQFLCFIDALETRANCVALYIHLTEKTKKGENTL